jgi:hypothetical protein
VLHALVECDGEALEEGEEDTGALVVKDGDAESDSDFFPETVYETLVEQEGVDEDTAVTVREAVFNNAVKELTGVPGKDRIGDADT